MIVEHDRVVVVEGFAEYGLEEGDVGTVVHVHGEGAGFEVEFVSLDGATSNVVEVSVGQVRGVEAGEIPHARAMASIR